MVKNPPAKAGDIKDAGLIPRSGRSPGGKHGNPLQCSCLENSTDRGAWKATVRGVTKSWTRLKRHSNMLKINFTCFFYFFFFFCGTKNMFTRGAWVMYLWAVLVWRVVRPQTH